MISNVPSLGLDAQVAVVGGGVAGVVAASTLAAAGHRVVVIEAGAGTDRPPRDLFAARDGNTLSDLRARRTSLQPVTPYLAGTGIGGSARINGLLVDGPDPVIGPLISVPHARWTSTEQRLATSLQSEGIEVGPAVILGDTNGRAELNAHLSHERIETIVGASVTAIERRKGSWSLTTPSGHITVSAVALAAGAFVTPRLAGIAGCTAPNLGRGLADHPSIALTLEGQHADDECSTDRFGPVVIARFTSGDRAMLLTIFDPVRSGFDVDGPAPLVMITLLDSRSRGHLVAGHAELRLLSDDGDRHALGSAVQLIGTALSRQNISWRGPDGAGPEHVLSLRADERDAWLLTNEGGSFHATGTMAPGPVRRFATDEHGRVYGCPSLFVVDAAGMSPAPTTAPMVAVGSLAFERASAIAADLS